MTSYYEGRVYHTSPSRTGRPRWRVFSLAQQTNVSGLCIRDVHNVYESGRSACSHQSSSRRIPSRLSIIRLAICFSWASSVFWKYFECCQSGVRRLYLAFVGFLFNLSSESLTVQTHLVSRRQDRYCIPRDKTIMRIARNGVRF